MLSLPPPRMARVVAASLASFCRALIDCTEPRLDCTRCGTRRRDMCEGCEGTGRIQKSEEDDFIGPLRRIPCTDCDGKGSEACGWCEDDVVERAVVTILGMDVLAEDLISLVNRQHDVFSICVDAGRLWLPRHRAGLVPFVEDTHDEIKASGTYDTRQLPLLPEKP